jgi:L-ascorbate metabolism protein UlaG (beta-lactamase superfamily)
LDGPDDLKRATMYVISADDIKVAVVGHIYPDLTDEQLEALGVVDVLVVPVGGYGYTLDAAGAVDVIRKIDPKVVIPTHYADSAVTYPVPQAELDVFIKELGAAVETSSKLKLKAGTLGETLVVQRLNRVV